MPASFLEADLSALIQAMTVDEKVDLLSGRRMWRTSPIPRLGIPSIVMTDGTYGVRYARSQIDEDAAAPEGGDDFAAFLGVVTRKANEAMASGPEHAPATCFPNGSALGCTWDVTAARAMGSALAAECQALGVHLLLGPGINIRRTPLGGRGYEYYGEDPVIAGELAAALIEGLQAGGVGASLKHFACNNAEIERTTMDSVVDLRALREIYLAGFERAVRKARPWTVMSSYNRLNGLQAAEHPWLLTTVLRQDWGYAGLVVSDWHGIKDRAAALAAGNDLDMPESAARKAQLKRAIEQGRLPMATVDRACLRVLELVRKAKAGERRGRPVDSEAHHRLARRLAGEAIVLLKNEGSILPLDPAGSMRIAVVGRAALAPVYQGSGCATTAPSALDIPLDELRKAAGPGVTIAHYPGHLPDAADPALEAAAVAGAAEADIVIVFAHTIEGEDGEGADRQDLALAPGQDALIEAVAAANERIVVVLANPDAVLMPWLPRVKAVLETFFAGQAMGGAVADILFGKVNPSGKLSVTFPARLEDTPAFLTYPGENGRHLYAEGLHVGYRAYDKRRLEPLFPFGFGLSYTAFAYAGLDVPARAIGPGEGIDLSFELTNEGQRAGKEICQLYVAPGSGGAIRPRRELKGFLKVELAAGETKRVCMRLEPRDFCRYDPDHGWVADDGTVEIEIGASSRDIRLRAPLRLSGNGRRFRPMAADIQPVFVLDNPIARRHLSAALEARLGLDPAAAASMLEHCRTSFFGIFTTFDRRFGVSFAASEIETLIEAINRDMQAAGLSAPEPCAAGPIDAGPPEG